METNTAWRKRCRLAFSTLAALCLPLLSASQHRYPLESDFIRLGHKELASSRGGMVASPHPFATEAALEMLRRGGNAVDAAVAAAAVAAVVDNGKTSFGGGGGLVYWNATSGKAVALNFEAHSFGEEVLPYNRQRDGRTGRSIRVGGAVAGFHAAVDKHGKLDWKDVMEPAIFYAENGFPIHDEAYATMKANYATLTLHPSGRRLFAPDGFLPGVGETFKQPELAETLKAIVREGPEYFYRGPFAEKMVTEIRAIGGKPTLEDFSSYEVWETEPLRGTYKDFEILATRPPLVGPVGLIEALQILENVDLESMGHYTESADSLQWLIETMRAVDERKFTGIPELDETIARARISKDYARKRYEMIRHKIEQMKRQATDEPTVSAASHAPNGGIPEEHNTNNISVVDEEGNLCSLTNTIYGCVYSCSGLLVDGMVLNSAGGHPAHPGQRLMSPKSPMVVLKEGQPFFAAGSSGGVTNPFFLMTNVLIWGKSFEEAQEAPRFRITSSFYTGWGMGSPGAANTVHIEHRIDEAVAPELTRRGYRIEWLAPFSMRNAQIAGVDPGTGVRYGASDPRGEGMAAGTN